MVAFVLWMVLGLVLLLLIIIAGVFHSIDPSLFGLLSRFLSVTMPLVQPFLLVCVTLLFPLLWFGVATARAHARDANSSWQKTAWKVIAFLWAAIWVAAFIFLFVYPLFLLGSSSNIRPDGDTRFPSPPRLIAHRLGASLGPENTIPALLKTVEIAQKYPGRIVAVETDIHWSQEGFPFLLHDTTFRRTTNVASVFPSSVFRPPHKWSWSSIQKLDAGSWFVDGNPFGTIGSPFLSKSEAELYRGTKIPSLIQYLRVVREKAPNLRLIWDPLGLRPLNWIRQLLYMINATETASQVFWISNGENATEISDLRDSIDEIAPGVTLVSDADVSNSTLEQNIFWGFSGWNGPLGTPDDQLRDLKNLGLFRIAYTVNELWIYSQLWLTGLVSFCTSNSVQDLASLDQPHLWTMSRTSYIAMFATVNCICVLAVPVMIWLFFKKSPRPEPRYTLISEASPNDSVFHAPYPFE